MPIRQTIPISGERVVVCEMPNLYAILAQVGRVPDQHTLDVIRLLTDEGLWSKPNPSDDPDHYRKLAQHVRSLYVVASLCMVEPRLILDAEPGPNEWGPSDLSWEDVQTVYWLFFRRGGSIYFGDAPAPQDDHRVDEPALVGA